MTRRHLLVAGLLLVAAAPSGQWRPSPGGVLDRSTIVRPGTYGLASADADHPAIRIVGSNLTIDFTGVTLQGGPPLADPDGFTGVAVLVDGGENVTIRNLSARGYKIGVLARGTRRLHITGANLSYNWKSRLYSLVEHESLVDWMSYHHNERDEWLQKGAGIYLADSTGAEIDNTTITQGENGLMLVRSTGATVWNNDLSYLSGVGLGLYRSSGNTIEHNRIDFCVRGYSHGYYNRGQDSAGILMYEQSSRNTVAYNSVTHGGDGLFLWAGQSTMDTGQGGTNDNVFYDNDFSFAPTNGIEATFSRNDFLNNRVEGNWHGLWGGYSYGSNIVANRFARNAEGIAIEHGQGNYIAENTFDGDDTAIHLWANATQDPDWGYPKHHDTQSHDYTIRRNRFLHNDVGLKVERSEDVRVALNTFDDVRVDVQGDGVRDGGADPIRDFVAPRRIPGAMDAKTPDSDRRGREAIIVDDWGPYDWKSPKLWPAGRSDAVPLKLRVLGPAGQWRVASVRGATVAPREGSVPGEIVVDPEAGPAIDFDLRLTYTGARVVSPRGEVTAAGRPYTFGYARYFVPVDWDVRYFVWTDQARVFAGTPVRSERRDRLDYMSGRAIADGVPNDRVSIVAEGAVDLPRGTYEIRTISDDGIRVWVDGERVLDDWTAHESKVDRAPLPAGKHRIRVEYYEVEGFAELRFEILRR